MNDKQKNSMVFRRWQKTLGVTTVEKQKGSLLKTEDPQLV